MARLLILVNGLPGAGKTTLATRLGSAMDAVVLSKDAIKEAVADAVVLDERASQSLGGAAMEMAWRLAAAVEDTAVVESWWFRARDREWVAAGLAIVDADDVVEIWCDPPAALARERYRARARHPIHRDTERLARDWATWEAGAVPIGLCPTVVVDTSDPVDIDTVVAEIRQLVAPTAGSSGVG